MDLKSVSTLDDTALGQLGAEVQRLQRERLAQNVSIEDIRIGMSAEKLELARKAIGRVLKELGH